MRHLFQRPLCGGETDSLHFAFGNCLKPLERERQVGAPLGRHDGVDLIDDHRIHPAQARSGIRSKQQIKGLRGGDQNLGRVAAKAASLLL
jgi:hypothetical protein